MLSPASSEPLIMTGSSAITNRFLLQFMNSARTRDPNKGGSVGWLWISAVRDSARPHETLALSDTTLVAAVSGRAVRPARGRGPVESRS